MIPPASPTRISIVNMIREHMAAFSFAAPMATIINTKEFSLKPMPPIETGIMAIAATTGTINTNDARLSPIPRDLAARK